MTRRRLFTTAQAERIASLSRHEPAERATLREVFPLAALAGGLVMLAIGQLGSGWGLIGLAAATVIW